MYKHAFPLVLLCTDITHHGFGKILRITCFSELKATLLKPTFPKYKIYISCSLEVNSFKEKKIPTCDEILKEKPAIVWAGDVEKGNKHTEVC